MTTAPVQLLQALLEAVAYRFARATQLLAPFLAQDCQVIASGGGIRRSPYWLQVMADVLQRPISVLQEPEVTRRGAAVLVLHALGIWPTLDAMLPEAGRTYYPDPDRAEVYEGAAERQHQLYDNLIRHGAEISQRLQYQVVRGGNA